MMIRKRVGTAVTLIISPLCRSVSPLEFMSDMHLRNALQVLIPIYWALCESVTAQADIKAAGETTLAQKNKTWYAKYRIGDRLVAPFQRLHLAEEAVSGEEQHKLFCYLR